MERTIQKLAIFFAIMGITLFCSALTASADPSAGGAIKGDYYVTGGGAGLIAMDEITRLKAEPRVAWAVDSFNWMGVYTFAPDGTGSVRATQFHVQRFGPSLWNRGIQTYNSELKWKFKYSVKEDGKISFTIIPDSYTFSLASGDRLSAKPFPVEAIPTEGVIHNDGEFLTVLSKSQQLINPDAMQNIPAGGVASWNSSIVLVKQHD